MRQTDADREPESDSSEARKTKRWMMRKAAFMNVFPFSSYFCYSSLKKKWTFLVFSGDEATQ